MKNINVLLDTNILLDWLLDRKPYADNAIGVLKLCNTGTIKGYVAAHSITNIFYIARKQLTLDELKGIIKNLMSIVTVVPIDADNIRKAMELMEFSDIEDAIQTQCAIDVNTDYILTRNEKDFNASKIKVIDYDAFNKLLD